MQRVRSHEVDGLLQRTRSPEPRERAEAVRTLCPCHTKRNDPRVWDQLICLAGDSDVRVRRQVLHVLADGSPRERKDQIVATIEAMADDADVKLRRRVRKVLAQYRRTGNINVL